MFDCFCGSFDEVALKEGKQKEGADTFDAKEIFGGEYAAELEQERDDGVARVLGAQGFEREAEGKQIKNEGDEFLVDVRERYPMLAVTGKDEHEERGCERETFPLGPDLIEHPPRGEAEEVANDEREDLPVERDGGNEAGGREEYRPKEWTEGCKSRDEFARAEEFRNPSERPVVPIETGEGKEQTVTNDGDNCKEQGN